jgi:antitoxin VapB
MSPVVTRIFMNGNSQAVRIPQEFRLDASSAEISRNEHGDLVIRAVPVDRGASLMQALEAFEAVLGAQAKAEYVAALERGQAEQLPPQEREAL